MTNPDEELPPEDDAVEETTDVDAEADQPAPRGRRRQIMSAKAEELATWDFFTSHGQNESIDVVLKSDQIGTHSGLMSVIGYGIQRVANVFESLGSRPTMHGLAFGQSVTLEVRPSPRELDRAVREYAQALALREEQAEDATIAAVLAQAVPDVHVAAAIAYDLLSAPSSGAPEAAVALGAEVTQAYKSLATIAARHDLSVSIDSPQRERPVMLSPEKAARVVEELRTSSERVTRNVPVYGVLSLADSTHKGFGLRIDAKRRRPLQLKGKQIVYGTYSTQAERQIMELGLWGKPVRASIRIDRDALVSTASIRPPVYTLISVQPDRA